ncbi:hypothetical protein [Bradyrhizobium glycinis]|nr:hypothetical protein [Bradyrhizobium glycinis]
MSFRVKDVFTGTQAALGADPAQAQAAFHAQSRLGDYGITPPDNR